jgi:enoyl-CoA hydratase
MTKPILYEKVSNKAYITLNRPDAMNAMTPEGFRQLAEAFKEAGEDKDVRVIILTGSGDKAFCSGADLKETIPAISEGRLDPNSMDDAVLKHTPLWKPVITAINGHCLAGGMEILQATDIRIAAEHATFGLPEPKWSIMAAAGSLVRLVRQIPYCRAMEILLTGESITAEEALEIGLINKIVPYTQLLEEAESYAEKICRNGPIAVQATKEAVVRLQSLPMDQAFHEEWNYANKAFTSDDAKEGLKGFAEKRVPHFHGH